MDGLDLLLAERSISRVLHAYARAADRHDWAGVRACFHPDATDDHLGYRGGIDGLVAWLAERHRPLTSSVHLLGNVTIDVLSPASAVAETYCLTAQRTSGAGDLTVHSRYIDEFERRGAGPWLIARRAVVMSHSRIDPEGTGFEAQSPDTAAWMRAAFGPTDPVYARLGATWHS